MKVKEARNRLSDYRGDELWQEARDLYRQEIDFRIQARSYGKPPSRGTIEGVLKEMRQWMRQAGKGLYWGMDSTLNLLIESEVADTWVRYEIIDPRVDDYAKRVRFQMLRGSPLPGLQAMTTEHLNALSHMAMAQISREVQQLSEKYEKQDQ